MKKREKKDVDSWLSAQQKSQHSTAFLLTGPTIILLYLLIESAQHSFPTSVAESHPPIFFKTARPPSRDETQSVNPLVCEQVD